MARQYARTAERIAARRQHLAFNLRTKRYGLTPQSLWVRPLVDSQEGRDIARRTSIRFLMARITQNARTIRELDHDLYFQRRQRNSTYVHSTPLRWRQPEEEHTMR